VTGTHLVIRTDTSVTIGAGHVMRCLALAQAWRDNGGQSLFVMAPKVASIEARLVAEGMQVVYLATESGSEDDARQTVQLAQQLTTDMIVLDGYQFDAVYQQTLKQAGCVCCV